MININAEALFNIEQRPQDPLTNDIDASSEFGLNGTVEIDTPEVDAIQGVIELPTNVIEADTVVASICSADEERGSNGLTVIGKGGIPPEPTAPISDDIINIEGQAVVAESNAKTELGIDTSLGKIYPARGILVKNDGTITLTAYPTANLKTRTPVAKINCDR
jgi:large exoprotein involved in heme utilization and adhesion